MKEFEHKEASLKIPSKASSNLRRRNIMTSSMRVDKKSRTNISVDASVPNTAASMLFKITQKANKENLNIKANKPSNGVNLQVGPLRKDGTGRKERTIASSTRRRSSSNFIKI